MNRLVGFQWDIPFSTGFAPLCTMDTRLATPPAGSRAARGPRRRLSPALRMHQILDAALDLFAERGYADTRMDDIAQQALLSKGGLYAHFRSKERVFEALLERALAPLPLDAAALADEAADLPDLVARYLDQTYAWMADPDRVRILRLLLTENHRVPTLIARWREQAVEQQLRAITAMLTRARERGLCRATVLDQHPWLVLSPLLHGIVMSLLQAPQAGPALEQRRAAHAALLIELLTPRNG
ncbi:MAG: TetR/AcrR family transcriptional regulator [Bordetella sp.]|nr:TetR/AcrR family transcriptional regulator [Bordetella genomosp. 1]MDQ8035198.1 TetR/AcrR family transcriptional regulator [Bordetella sp.]